ncbi:hypothetical protein [Enterococcus faecalis]|uniref:hypothetical protein n=1 Tax=Enterococcus faecalis TaxID=1351 RepID=UPI002DB8ED32|nr:hypothetical protein [Enterococcus faecalis]MEB7792064.1 hypothetical protein [Enterococcus faecalis]MEB7810052.1 hypothetical protein [Enterococcus faecalis]
MDFEEMVLKLLMLVLLAILGITVFFAIFTVIMNSKNQRILEQQNNVIVKEIEFHSERSTTLMVNNGNGVMVPQYQHYGAYWEIVAEADVEGELISASYSLEEKPDFHVGDKLSVKGKELRKIE